MSAMTKETQIIMQTIQPINPEHATGAARRLLDTAKAELGVTSNLIKTMAHSPGALEAYLEFHRALTATSLEEKARVQIALAVAQAQQCDYALAEYTSLARQLGMTDDDIMASRNARARDPKIDSLLRFTHDLRLPRSDAAA